MDGKISLGEAEETDQEIGLCVFRFSSADIGVERASTYRIQTSWAQWRS